MYNQIDSNKRRTVYLFLFFSIFIIGVGWAFSYVYESQAILSIAVAIAVFQSWFSYYFSDSVSLAVAGAKVAPTAQFPELHRVIENLSITSGLPKPKIYVINDPAPNAFATGRNPKHASIAVTTGLLEIMEKRELEGVLAHELSHVGNYDILVMTVTVTLVGVIVLLSDIFMRSLWFRGRDDNNRGGGYLILIGIALAILAPIFAKLIQLAISRKREYLADASGSLLTRFPEGLATALEKIEKYEQPMKRVNRATAHLYINEPFGVDDRKQSWLTTIISTHPPIADRVDKLRKM
ncbi:MAG: M48 family metalloprotease [Candidatus Berkelbacteria bacterium]|nr:M48 family metalloprotease [Candidatus Berkelbacteria bacterium]MCR4307226.1 M48 family metalloprotease [Candidatus Berkelbacteria bacterium]